jgi:RNA polymerase sigma factor (sigma-70 family)
MTSVALDYEALTDIELAKLIARRDSLAVRVVTRRNNQRLYRTAWSVLKNRTDAEETVQEGYLKGFAAIDSFAGESSLSTWLSRIVLNEALGRRRSAQRRIRLLREHSIALIDDYRENLMGGSAASSSGSQCRARPGGQASRAGHSRFAGSLPDRLHVARGRRLERREDCRGSANSFANREDPPATGAATLAGGPRSHLAGRSARRVPLCR